MMGFIGPLRHGEAVLGFILELEEKYGFEMKDTELDEIWNKHFDIFEVNWKPEYMEKELKRLQEHFKTLSADDYHYDTYQDEIKRIENWLNKKQ